MSDAQRMWDAAIAAAFELHKLERRLDAERKAAALKRRREQYARLKASGEIDRQKAERAKKKVAAKEAGAAAYRELQGGPRHTSCYCQNTPMPPCAWCTDPDREDDEA